MNAEANTISVSGSIDLNSGLNVIGFPVDPAVVPDSQSLLPVLGDATQIDKVQWLNPTTGKYEETAYDAGGTIIGDTFPVQTGDGWLVYAKTSVTLNYDVTLTCPQYSLHAGINLASFPHAGSALTAYALLETLGGPTMISSVQGLDPTTGQFQTAGYKDDLPIGPDFPILPDRGYFVLMRSATAYNPVPVLDSLNPDTVSPGSGDLLLTLNGSHFVPGSLVDFGGALLTPTLLTSTQLQVTVPAPALMTPGTIQVSVISAAPGCGASNALPFGVLDSNSTVPDPPQIVQVIGGDGQVTVSWDAVSGATSYNIYWNTTGAVTTSDNVINNVTSPNIHTGLTNGTTYYYVVTAVNSVGESDASLEVSVIPLPPLPVPPSDVDAIPGDGRARIMWNSVSGADGYIIYWSSSDDPANVSSFKREGQSTIYLHSGLNNGTEYTYSVSAFNMSGESGRSDTVTTIPDSFSSSGVLTVSAGDVSTTCSVRMDGSLWCWGKNPFGMFGNGTNYSTSIPVRINLDADWHQVSVGSEHTCATKTDGSLWCWGSNMYGQLGAGSISQSDVPVQVGVDNDWEKVNSEGVHTCAIKTDGSLWCWGRNRTLTNTGVLGVGSDADNVMTPSRVGVASNWVSIEGFVDGAHAHLCALTDVGDLWCWGTIIGSKNPILVDSMGWDDVDVSGASGDIGTCLIKGSDGSRWCWGDNRDGRFGNGTTGSVSSLSQMSDDVGWMEISGGVDHICGLHADNSVWCWGYNGSGRLGTGTDVENELYPTPIASNDKWLQVDVGGGHTCAVRDDNTLWCWGNGYNGELGTGLTGFSGNSNTPVEPTNAGLWP